MDSAPLKKPNNEAPSLRTRVAQILAGRQELLLRRLSTSILRKVGLSHWDELASGVDDSVVGCLCFCRDIFVDGSSR